MAEKIPWPKIRAEWVKGGITQQQLADKYGVKVKTIQNRAYKEGWKNTKRKIAEKTEEKTQERVVRARVNHLEKLIQANEALMEGLIKITKQISEEPEKTLFDKNGTLRNAESIAKAIETATTTQRDLYKLPNIDQKFAAKKWREQMKLDREKAKGVEGAIEKLAIVIHEPPAEEGEEDAGSSNS